MTSQPAPRPWFRLASMARPAAPPAPTRPPAPPPVPQQTFRPPVAPPQQIMTQPPPPRPTPTAAPAPPLPTRPITPAPTSSPVTSPPAPPSRASAPSSPILRVEPAPISSADSPSRGTPAPMSPSTTGIPPPSPSKTRSPIATPAPPPPASSTPSSPVIKTSSSLPAPPSQKASLETAATRPEASVPTSPVVTITAFKPVPSSPVPPPPSPVPTSSPITTVKDRAATPISSPKIVKPWAGTPPQSPKVNSFARPPSPLMLPPAQLKVDSEFEPIPAEAEQKTVLMQETDEKSKTSLRTSNVQQQEVDAHNHKNNGDRNSNSAQNGKRELKKDKGIHKKTSDSEEFGFRVITLAGENKGAIMELSPSRKKYVHGENPYSLQEKASTRAWINGQKSRNKYDSFKDEESSKMKDEIPRASATQSPPMDAFINSNVQVVNNSILYNCSCTHNDPGVHLSVSKKGNGGRGVHSENSISG